MIDVTFQLLIFFLVATRFAEEEREMNVQLPTASEAQPLSQPAAGIVDQYRRPGALFRRQPAANTRPTRSTAPAGAGQQPGPAIR